MIFKKKTSLILISLLIILTSACYSVNGNSGNEAINASGTIAADTVNIAPEIGGKVTEILVSEGDSVQAGEVLFRIDDELLQAQRHQAVTALESAHANLSTAQTGLEMAQAALRTAEISAETTNANVDAELLPTQQALDDLYETHEVIKAGTQENVAAANRGVREAQYRLDNFTVPISQKDMTAMEAIGVMKERLDKARQDFEPYKYRSSGDPTREDLKEAMDEAQSDYDAAVKRMEYETALKKAEAALEKAMEDLAVLADGPDPDDVAALEARITAIQSAQQSAEAAVVQAGVGVVQAQAILDQAEKAVAQVQAELDLIDVQMGKLVVSAPVSGVVMSRNVETGEVVAPGSTLFVIGQLEEVKLTVYVPEDKYGQVNLEDEVSITVDSFPGEAFQGTVTHISDKAEFTPRNVQTVDGRKTTVYAVKINVPNADLSLKPGMPADVTFPSN